MQFLAEQHLVAAKLVRENGARRSGAERELFIQKSNSFVVAMRLMVNDRGGVCLDNFDWSSATPDWSVIEEQVLRLAPPHVDSPPLAPSEVRQ
jgi:hypothetical protein